MAETPPTLPVKQWAAHKKVSPQLVHYYLRTNEEFKATAKNCECGRRVLIVELADKVWDQLHLEEDK